MNTADVFVIGRKLALGLAAGIPVLSVVGVYLLARFTKVFDAYAGERAKLQVQFDNVEKLVRQNRRITRATEKIKADLSGEAWLEQQRWSKKVEIYAGCIAAQSGFREAMADFVILLKRTGREPHIFVNEEHPVFLAYKRALFALQGANSLLFVSGSPDAVEVVLNAKLADEEPISADSLRKAMRGIHSAQLELIAAVRAELGYAPLE